MSLDYVCLWVIVAIGAFAGAALQRRFGKIGLPLFFVFVIAADAHLYWPQVVVRWALRSVGWQSVVGSPYWGTAWTLLPVVLLALIVWWLVSDAWQEKGICGSAGWHSSVNSTSRQPGPHAKPPPTDR